MVRIGLEGDNRKYRRLKSSDYYEAKAAAEAEVHKWDYCMVCGRKLEKDRKNWGGFCFECKNEPL